MFLQLNATDMGMDASSNVPARDHPVLCRLFQFHLYREFHLYNKLAGRPRGPTRVGFLETSSPVVECGFIQHAGEGGGVGKGKKDTGYHSCLQGLDGRPRPVPCAHLWGNAITPPAPGDPTMDRRLEPLRRSIVGAMACPRPAMLHSFFHAPTQSFMVARVALSPQRM